MHRIDRALDDFANQIVNKLTHIDFAPILPKIERIIDASINRNFVDQGRYGSGVYGGGHNQWKPSKRSLNDKTAKGKTTLRDTGALKASINIYVRQEGNSIVIEMGSNLVYAPIQHFGGKIHHPAREGSSKWKASGSKKSGYKYRFTKKSSKTKNTIERKYQVGAYDIEIPARPYLVLQDEDIQAIQKIIEEYIFKILNS